MRTRLRIVIPILLVVILVVVAIWYFTSGRADVASGVLTASGTIEATEVQVSPELGGRVISVTVDEGDHVQAGDVLVQLDATLLESQRAQAVANLQAAQANLALLKAGATQDQLNAAQAQLDQAEANRKAVKANVDAMTAGSRPEDIAVAHDNLDRTRTEYTSMTVVLSNDQVEEAHSALTKAEGNLSQAKARKTELGKDTQNPTSAIVAASDAITESQQAVDAAQEAYQAVQDGSQPYYLQIQKIRNSWQVAENNKSQAQARLDFLQTEPDMPTEAIDSAQATVDDFQSLVDSAKSAYDALATGDLADQLNKAWTDVQDAEKQLNSLAKTAAPGTPSLETLLDQLDAATAQRDMAAANQANLKSGARAEQIDAAQAQVQAAQSAINTLDVQISKLTIKSPADGVVLSRSIQPGETVGVGVPLLTLGRLDDLTITVYIPEDRYGTVRLGQKATVTVDSFPGETFSATVTHIADKAEFTPRNVQTAEGRRTTVFAIKLSVKDPQGKLKPGMPADVKFVE